MLDYYVIKCCWSVSWKTNFIFSLGAWAWGTFSCQCLLLWKQKIKIISLFSSGAVNHHIYKSMRERERERERIKLLQNGDDNRKPPRSNRSNEFIASMTFSFPGDLLPCQLRSHFLTWYEVQTVYFLKAISFFIVWRRMGFMSGNTVDPCRFRFLNLITSRHSKHKIPLNIYCSLPYEVLKSKARYIIYYAEQLFKAAWNARALY